MSMAFGPVGPGDNRAEFEALLALGFDDATARAMVATAGLVPPPPPPPDPPEGGGRSCSAFLDLVSDTKARVAAIQAETDATVAGIQAETEAKVQAIAAETEGGQASAALGRLVAATRTKLEDLAPAAPGGVRVTIEASPVPHTCRSAFSIPGYIEDAIVLIDGEIQCPGRDYTRQGHRLVFMPGNFPEEGECVTVVGTDTRHIARLPPPSGQDFPLSGRRACDFGAHID